MRTVFYSTAAAAALIAGVAQAQMVIEPGSDDRINWQSLEDFKASHTGLEGQEFNILGPWLGADRDLFTSLLPYFEEATGAKANYSGSDSFEQQIVIDSEAGSPPDVAVLPQPGLAADLAAKGHITPLGDEMAQWVRDNYAAGDSWADLGTYAGADGSEAFYAFPFKADVKSLVWYVPENFEDAGYEVPETYEDLKALSEQIAEDGETPWCIGLGSGGATGWPATDWVEDLMLRINSPEDYDAWTTNEMPFNDPKVVAAIEEFGWFAKNDDFVAGGAGSVASTDFRDSPKGLFEYPPDCYMHRQASFIPSFFPEGTEIGLDADFFYFPAPADGSLGQPVLGGGTLFSVFSDNQAAMAFIDFLKVPAVHEIWMAQKGFVTPHTGVNTDAYGDETLKRMGQILLDATTFRFDGSDLMPGSIGAGAFWTGMVDFVGGKSAQDVADAIQQSWTTVK
ncbi:ABC transporter substrate-binding protein [Paracoccus saliphilus]|uniref:Carbohydrate ABC transporter substrate-binding protein n=1 Tax=Paracoccus saliphilus TaxID=405559 RepID=A0AA45W0X9_9RHOB|nr:ABC transporter substrate-binding protein [Paracoccus saliphilus]WCR03374.1 carbohydrate ABC transporter substrate-binding protein [Paracoccus saliphilus]SIS52441.1 maltose-binding protein /trehalose-binding protein /sucrose-binding protein [Paracoccus saliphilus]